ncbi:MAG: DNA repair protein RecO [Micrococcaceae bacterium]
MRGTSFASKSYKDNAIVIRTHKLGESDRIITLLTQHHGIVRAVAKGVRKTKSKFGARLEPSMVVDALLVHGRNLDIVSQVESLGAYTELFASDYQLYIIGSTMLETAEKLYQDTDQTFHEYNLLLGALNALNNQHDDPHLILDAYLLRAVSQAGWTPSFIDCAKCGKAGPHKALSIPLGGAVCENCRPPGAAAPDTEVFEVLDGLLNSRWAKPRVASTEVKDHVHSITANYVQYHIDKKIKSLNYVEIP